MKRLFGATAAIAIIFLFSLVSVPLASADWTMFHADPSRSGASTGNAVTKPTLLWKYKADGTFYSSPAVSDGVVYIGSEGEGNYNVGGGVYALNATTGTQLWNYQSYVFQAYASVQSSPAVANGIVYIGSGDEEVHALNASSGAQLWAFTTGEAVTSSPAVVNGVVYVCSTVNGGVINYGSYFNQAVYALNATSGDELWSYTPNTSSLNTNLAPSSPAVVGGVVYFGFGDNVYALNAADGTQLWSYTTGGAVFSSPAVVDGVVYVGGGFNVYALNAANGAQIWNYTTGNPVESSPAVVGGVVYVGSEDNNVYALNAVNGAKLWSYATRYWGIGFSSPAVVGGVVYVGSKDNNVYALNAANGKKLWNYTTGGIVDSSPAVVNGVVYVGSDDGYVYALGASSTSSLSSSPTVPEFPNQLLGITLVVSLMIVLSVVVIAKKRRSGKIQSG